MMQEVYLAVRNPVGHGDEFEMDDTVWEFNADAVERANELGPMWSVVALDYKVRP